MSAAVDVVTEAEVVDLLMTRALWSAGQAASIRAAAPWWAWGGRALRPALAALIDDHDRNAPPAPTDGPGRVASVWRWIEHRAADVAAAELARENWRYARRDGTSGPEPVDPFGAAASHHAQRYELPDPGLIRHASAVLTVLPQLVAPDAHTTAGTSELLAQLERLRADNLAAALKDLEH